MPSITVTGNVVEDEDLGIVTLAADSNATNPDNNVILSNFQSRIASSSSLGAELKALGIYPDTTTNSALWGGDSSHAGHDGDGGNQDR